MKIAILSINIGEYDVFWPQFFKSAEKNLFPECHTKEYFVFTDSPAIKEIKNKVHIYKQKDLGWPFNTMKRFHFFQSIHDDLEDFDYIFFANANAEFLCPISFEIIIDSKDIIMIEHPGYHFVKKENLPFERKKSSNAFVPIKDGNIYVQGAFYGGKKEPFLQMIEILDARTEDDLKNNIVAIWHDESFLNWYAMKHYEKIQILGWQYLKYEEYVMPYRPVIVLRNKRKFLSKQNARFSDGSLKKAKIMIFLRNCKWRMMIKLKIIKYVENIQDGVYKGRDISESAR